MADRPENAGLNAGDEIAACIITSHLAGDYELVKAVWNPDFDRPEEWRQLAGTFAAWTITFLSEIASLKGTTREEVWKLYAPILLRAKDGA